jgi:hypothetical protein
VSVLTDQTAEDTTIRVPHSVNEVLDSVKKSQGISKKDWFKGVVLQWKFLNNDDDFDTSKSAQSDALVLKNLKRTRDGLVAKGATSAELVAFDEAIKITENRLKLYRDGDGEGV